MIIAKPVIENQYWILNNETGKIGQIESDKNGFIVKIGNQAQKYNNIKTIQMRTDIQFTTPTSNTHTVPQEVQGFPTDGPAYNSMYDIHSRIPLFTKLKKSKSWYAAGYYKIKHDNKWKTVFCPKLILLRRYEYIGPEKTKDGFKCS